MTRALAPALIAVIVFLGLGAWFAFREPKAAPRDDETREAADAPPRFPVEDRSAVSGSVARLLTDETIAAVDDLREAIEKRRTDDASFAKSVDARLVRLERAMEELTRRKKPEEAKREPPSAAEVETAYVFFEVARMDVRLREFLADPELLLDAARDQRAAAEAYSRLRGARPDLERVKTVEALVEFRVKYPELR